MTIYNPGPAWRNNFPFNHAYTRTEPQFVTESKQHVEPFVLDPVIERFNPIVLKTTPLEL